MESRRERGGGVLRREGTTGGLRPSRTHQIFSKWSKDIPGGGNCRG